MVKRGTTMVVCPGIKWPPISIPSGGVSRVTMVGIGGYSRSVSSIIALRCGRCCRAAGSCVSISPTSANIFSEWRGYLARQYRMNTIAGAEESLLTSVQSLALSQVNKPSSNNDRDGVTVEILSVRRRESILSRVTNKI